MGSAPDLLGEFIVFSRLPSWIWGQLQGNNGMELGNRKRLRGQLRIREWYPNL